ncbi:putative bifunctional diguanylate cyclase/phosphodiesterase [Planomonospora corallina]|uniref:Bifunctional diguanylate cyclase/phosphodiesterase n=1 Tax=Planomonospora corallina TaxID=1806052 RepID=A0ABV8IIU7_9ACTN
MPPSTVPARAPVLPPVPALGVLTVFGLGWFVLNFVHPLSLPVVGWAPMVLAAVVGVLACARVARSAELTAPARTFWRSITTATAAILVAVLSNAYDMVSGFGGAEWKPGAHTMAFYVAGVLVTLWALLRLPAGDRSRGAWLTLGLDAGIVVLAAGLFAWSYAVNGSSALAEATGSYLPVLGTALMGFIGVLAAVKLALTGVGPLDRGSLTAMGLGLLAGATAGAFLSPLQAGRPDLSSSFVAVPLTFLFVGIAAERQLRTEGDAVRVPRRRRRPFSLLPYGAIAATGALLLVSVRKADGEIRVIAAGVLVITALVVVRQILAFYDNAHLLSRLDSSMLELGRLERWSRSLVQNSSDIIAVTALEGHILFISPSVERILGTPAETWIGGPVTRCTHPDDLPTLNELSRRLRQEPRATATCQVRMRRADGTWRWLEIAGANRLDDPSIRGIVSNVRDVTETKRFQDQLEYQATHDTLTRLANRDLFARRAESALAEAGGAGVALALIDLDDFKAINDRLGHAVGDALLTAVAERLRACVRPGDMVARLGGDEFAVLLRGVCAAKAEETAEQIILTLGTPVPADGHDLLVQASIGLVEGGPDIDANELLRRADLAMYAAKEQGKSRYVRYVEEMDARAVEHARLGAELRRALAAGQLFLLYQPVVALPDGELSSLEALVRWHHPERGMVSPAQFIPVAERNGMIVEIGTWVLREACRQMADWRRRYGAAAPYRMAVNVSARQLREPEFAQAVADVLEETGLAPEDLLLEITETAVFDGGLALETVRAVRELGVGVALDDFGTGHSSLGLLRTCPVDALKVDKLFVDGVTGTVENSAIATSLAQIARALRLQAVAEGVETEAQAKRLYQLGYRLAQGFHFAPPLPAGDIGRRLAERAARGDGSDLFEPPALAS